MNTLTKTEARNTDALVLTTSQLLELSEAFKRMSSDVTDAAVSTKLYRMGCKMWAYADKRRRVNEQQAQAFELSIRRVRSLKATGEVR